MKLFNYLYLSLVLLLSLASYSCAQNKATIDIKGDEKLIEFTTDRFTLPNLHITPDGENIIFDVLGDIYQVPIEGGKAKVVLKDNNWKRGAKLSPDGKTLAYVSDETGEFKVWTYNLETKIKRVYFSEDGLSYPLYPYWDFKGCLLVPNKKGLISYNVVTGKKVILRHPKQEELSVMHAVNRRMSVSKSGSFAHFQYDGALWAYDIEKQIDLFIGEVPDRAFINMQRASQNGESILYYKKNKNLHLKQDLTYWNLENNEIKVLRITDQLEGYRSLNHSFDFIDDHTIVLDKEGEIVRLNIETGEYQAIPIEVEIKKLIKKPLQREPQYIRDSIITASVLRNPVTRLDLDTIYFGAFGKLHSYAKATRKVTKIYPDEERFEMSPSLSPNGKYLAYTTWNDVEMGHVYARELSSGKEYQLTKIPGRYINPAWSPDNREIVYVNDINKSQFGVQILPPGPRINVYKMEVHRLKLKYTENTIINEDSELIKSLYPLSITPRRFYPIPVYHGDGRSIYISGRNNEQGVPILMEVDLISKEKISESPIPYNTDEVLVSPDGKNIAFIYDEKVLIDTIPLQHKLKNFEEYELAKKIHEANSASEFYIAPLAIKLPNAEVVFEIAPSYLFWQDENTLMWGSAEEVYTYNVRADKVEKIAEIKVELPRDIPKENYALTNAKIITINEREEVIEQGTILVKGNRIEEVGVRNKIKIPDDYKVYNLKGKTIIPGLIDVHAHYHNSPFEFNTIENFDLISNLAFGITSFYDPSVNVLDYRERAQMVEAGIISGPRIFASGNIILNSEMMYDYKVLDDIKDSNRVIASMVKLDVHGPIKEYMVKNKEKVKMLRNSAQKYNINITTHPENDFLPYIRRIVEGYSAIEHQVTTFNIQKDIYKFLGLSQVHYTPTLICYHDLGYFFNEITLGSLNKFYTLNNRSFNKSEVIKDFLDIKKEGFKSKLIRDNDSRSKNLHIARMKEIIDNNGLISVGGHGNPLPGIGTHWELWGLTYAGVSNYQALKAATINGAKKLDLQEELGSIEKGKLADLVVLNNDPIEDIFNSADIYITIFNGNVFE